MKARTMKQIELLIKENNLYPLYLKCNGGYVAFKTKELFNSYYASLSK